MKACYMKVSQEVTKEDNSDRKEDNVEVSHINENLEKSVIKSKAKEDENVRYEQTKVSQEVIEEEER